METLFTWLHLSDLHVRATPETTGSSALFRAVRPTGLSGASALGAAPPPGLHERLLQALRDDLVEVAEHRPDALMVTGDVTWSGSRDEFISARRWLIETARAVGLGPEGVFVVPGNHDVERDASARNEGLELRLLADLREGRRRLDVALEKPAARNLLLARLAPFCEFAFGFGPGSAPPAERLEWSHAVEARAGLQVRILGLNTAWLSMDDADRGELRVGSAPLERALGHDGEPRRGSPTPSGATSHGELVIALSHHPFRGRWLADEEAAEAWMNAHAHVHLTGQVHDPAAEAARAGSGGACVWIAAGASPAAPDQPEGRRRLGWSMGRVTRGVDGVLTVQVTPRRWSASQKKFVRDDEVLRDGKAYAERPLKLFVDAPPTVRKSSFPPPEAAPQAFAKSPSAPPPPMRATAPVRVPPPAQAPAGPLPIRVPPPAPAEARPPPPRVDGRRTAPLGAHVPGRATGTRPVEAPTSQREPPPPSFPPPAARKGPSLFEGPGALPALPVPYFVGRTGEMAALDEALRAGAVTCVVAMGLGGVGKTSLVQHFVATEARDLFDESAWIDARDLPAELGRVAKRFGWKHDERSPTVEEAGAFLREALSLRRVLLVIDNVDPGMATVRSFPVPPVTSKSRLVVTSRIVTLHEDLGRLAKPLRLLTWDDATCRAHFREVVPALAKTPDADLDRLSRRVGGLPLAVRLLAKQLLRPGVTAASLGDRLDHDPLSALDSAARGAERTVVATFEAALGGLGDAERRVLLSLAACAPATRADVVAAVAGVREEDADLALQGLAEQSLVEWLPEADQPYRLHDVVRMLLASLPGAAEAEAAHDAWALARAAEHSAPAAWQALDREVPEVLAVVEHRLRRGDGPGAWEALSPILAALDRRGMYGELVSAATRVLASLPKDSAEAAAALGHLGLAWCSLGEIGKAVETFDRALAISEAVRWPEGQGLALAGLGRCYGVLGDWDRAIAHHERAAAIHEVVGQRRAFADDLGNVGLGYRRTGDVSRAIQYLERAIAIHEDLLSWDGLAEGFGGLGLCFRDIGEHKSAVEYFERALEIHDAQGRAVGQATMLGNLGNTYRTLGDVPKAIEHLGRALAIYEQLGMLEGQGAALGNLGNCYKRTDPDKARAYFDRALSVLRRVGLPDDHPHVKMVLGALAKLGGKARPQVS